MKQFVVQNDEGKYLKRVKGAYSTKRTWKDNVWEATLFGRRCDATNSKSYCMRHEQGAVLTVEVRVYLEKDEKKSK